MCVCVRTLIKWFGPQTFNCIFVVGGIFSKRYLEAEFRLSIYLLLGPIPEFRLNIYLFLGTIPEFRIKWPSSPSADLRFRRFKMRWKAEILSFPTHFEWSKTDLCRRTSGRLFPKAQLEFRKIRLSKYIFFGPFRNSAYIKNTRKTKKNVEHSWIG